MGVIQANFTISDAAAAGIARGDYRRVGGVVREIASGEIVEHLKDVGVQDVVVTTGVAAAAAKTTAASVKKSAELTLAGKITISTLIVAGLVAVGVGSYKLITYIQKQTKAKKVTNEIISKNEVIVYNPQLTEYFNNMQAKTMSLSSIKSVIEFFEQYSKGDLEIEISYEELLVIRNLIVRYTIKLCQDNKFLIDNKILSIEAKTTNKSELLAHITYATNIQKEIFG